MRTRLLAPACLVLVALPLWPPAREGQSLQYPAAPRGEVVDDYHGVKVADPYRWLEDGDDPRTAGWVQAERALAREFLARLDGRALFEARIAEGFAVGRTQAPQLEAGRLFFRQTNGLQPQPVLYVQDSVDGSPRAVLDPNTRSPDGSSAYRDYVASPDGRLLAYSVAEGGADAADTHVREVDTGRELNDVVSGALTDVCWTRDSRGFFYVRRPVEGVDPPGAAGIDKQLFYHRLGEPQSRDRLLQRWTDNVRWVYCMLSEDGRHAIVVAERGAECQLSVLPLGDAQHPDVTAPLTRPLGSGAACDTPIGTIGSTLYVRTDRDAPRQRVIALEMDARGRAQPRAIVPEAAATIADAVLVANRLAVHYLVDVKSELRLFDLRGRPAGAIVLPGVGAVGALVGRSTTAALFYSFSEFLSPETVYRYDASTGASTPFHAPRASLDTHQYETTQVFYTAKDGTRVPMFITARRDLKRDSRRPTLLTAYGGYGARLVPSFQPDLPAWLAHGGVYAVANIRGGGEYGEAWHRAGMLERKQTSFDDFIAAAEYLMTERYASPETLAVYGHSNGGLLVGAVLTQRPDLFAAAVANAGHHDMLRYHRFTVGAGWIPEYGAAHDPAAFEYLRAYSPLHNVRPGTCYPATLLLVSDHDDRVVPSHSYKFAAALQSAQACDRPILLRVAGAASHSYASRAEQIAERSDMWAFIASRVERRQPRDGRPGVAGSVDRRPASGASPQR